MVKKNPLQDNCSGFFVSSQPPPHFATAGPGCILANVIETFDSIVKSYEAVFFDAYGVLKTSTGVAEGTAELLARLEAQDKLIYVLTNDASRPPKAMASGYDHPALGPLVGEDHIISSGHLATEFLRDKVRTGRVAYLGPEAATHFIEEAGLEPVSVRDADENDDQLNALALLDDEGFDWFSDINRAVNLARRHNMPMIVANADLAYPVDNERVNVAIGSIANMMESILRKRFIHFGKPDAMMFNYAYERARRTRPALTKRDILMVGDTLHTDILGANKFGLDTVLVLSGNTLRTRAEALIEASGIIPSHICESAFT